MCQVSTRQTQEALVSSALSHTEAYMLCSVFKKPGGGKGRPGRNTKCIACGATWEKHGSAHKNPPSMGKRTDILNRIREPQKPQIETVEVTEIETGTIIEFPTTITTESGATKTPLISQDFVTDSSALVITESNSVQQEKIKLPIPERFRKLASVGPKRDLYEVADANIPVIWNQNTRVLCSKKPSS